MGNKHPSELKKLAYIFNLVFPPQVMPLAITYLPQEEAPALPLRVVNLEATLEEAQYPPRRVYRPGHI